MNTFLNLIAQRRIIASFVGLVFFILSAFGVVHSLDAETLTGLMWQVSQALGYLVPAVLALWSYISPKK